MKKWVILIGIVTLVVVVDVIRTKPGAENSDTSTTEIVLPASIPKPRIVSFDRNAINAIQTDKAPPKKSTLENRAPSLETLSHGSVVATVSQKSNQIEKSHSTQFMLAASEFSQAKDAVLKNLNLSPEQLSAIDEAERIRAEAMTLGRESGQENEVFRQINPRYEFQIQTIMGPEVYNEYSATMLPYHQKLNAIMQSEGDASN